MKDSDGVLGFLVSMGVFGRICEVMNFQCYRPLIDESFKFMALL